MVVMLFFEHGLWGLWQRKLGWELFPVRRRFKPPTP